MNALDRVGNDFQAKVMESILRISYQGFAIEVDRDRCIGRDGDAAATHLFDFGVRLRQNSPQHGGEMPSQFSAVESSQSKYLEQTVR